MSRFMRELKDRVAKGQKKIVLPETASVRVLQSAERVKAEGFAQPLLIGKPSDIIERASRYQIDLEEVEVVNPGTHPMVEKFIQYYVRRMASKKMSYDRARDILLSNPVYFGACLVAFDLADGMVAGAKTSSAEVLRAALQIIGPRKNARTISSSFIIVTDMMQFGNDGVFVAGDGDVVPVPTAEQLADIACNCVERAKKTLHIEQPKVALLSYSTMGSAMGEAADRVRQAVQILSDREVGFLFDGEMEADVALIPHYARQCAPRSPVAGQADVLIFPDLSTGNICCKMLEQIAGASILGPLLQGLTKPVMDLSRVSTVDTITDIIAVCCSDAMENSG